MEKRHGLTSSFTLAISPGITPSGPDKLLSCVQKKP